MDNTIENGNSLNTEETLESIIESQDTDAQKLEKLQEANKKLYARAKAAEEKAKAPKVETTPQLETNPVNSLTREEAILIAQGTDTASLEMLNKIAKLEGISLLEAKENGLYKSFVAQNEQEKKSAAAKLGASHGSGRIESKSLSGLSRDEHKRMFEEKMGH